MSATLLAVVLSCVVLSANLRWGRLVCGCAHGSARLGCGCECKAARLVVLFSIDSDIRHLELWRELSEASFRLVRTSKSCQKQATMNFRLQELSTFFMHLFLRLSCRPPVHSKDDLQQFAQCDAATFVRNGQIRRFLRMKFSFYRRPKGC